SAASLRLGRLVTAAIVVPFIAAAPVVMWRTRLSLGIFEELPARLRSVPSNAVIVTGRPCPAIAWIAAEINRDDPGRAVDWQSVCPGWGWPASLPDRLAAAQAEGRPIVLDMRDSSWIGDPQRAALAEVARVQRTVAAIVWR